MSKKNIKNYLENYNLVKNSNFEDKISELVNLIKKIKKNNKRIYILGNGASASISSHIANDLTKATKSKVTRDLLRIQTKNNSIKAKYQV